MTNIYKSGEYLELTETWHTEDSPWKASQITQIIRKNQLEPLSIADVGCGAGVILNELSLNNYFKDCSFTGYDISPQAINLCAKLKNEKIQFVKGDIFDMETEIEVLLAIDVFEHIPDYLGFLEKCQKKAIYKIYHIPLEIHISGVLRKKITSARYNVGHLHYFNYESAIATLIDTGHEVIDFKFTNGAIDRFKSNPNIKTGIANTLRWTTAKIGTPLAARLFGGYSLLILTK